MRIARSLDRQVVWIGEERSLDREVADVLH